MHVWATVTEESLKILLKKKKTFMNNHYYYMYDKKRVIGYICDGKGGT